ncbi:carbon starvation CstA family protein [Fontisphaera persica]|uniref:carbon starvation CstA family protein n=1 Tax=Fontisphaera persica TaxID=2974023 RepID=UPI0024C09B6B|nr:carbon starvation CstA family protein [Fontisphaera persica]WCJ58337.1 carbon starvation CstA family protein [Fontisphaera persica]
MNGKTWVRWLIWGGVAVLGAAAYATLAAARKEPINSGYLLIAALCTYAIGYRFYSKWLAAKVLALNDRRATPCEVHEDGKDYVKTNKWIVFGHHFAAISGPGPLVGPVLAAQFGYLPGTLWILIGVVIGGAVHDFVTLFASIRRDGKSLAQMVREEIGTTAGAVGMVGILAIMTILLAVLALVVVNALAESPWGVFTVGATIPIALMMGCYLRFLRVGKVLEVSAIGVVLLLLAVWGGQKVYASPVWSQVFHLHAETLAWAILVYGLMASVLPVWLLLAPRDYLSTFMKLGTIFLLALGVLLVLPEMQMPAVSKFVDGSGLVVPGKLFPFCFITIACGAISGFHALISSGITPKIITREGYARMVGYGAMCLESLVAIMAMIAACTLDPGVYLAMNVKGAGADPAADIRQKVSQSGFYRYEWNEASRAWLPQPVTVDAQAMTTLAEEVGEKTLYGRTGGAATLAVGMANIFSRLTHGRWLDIWYHFAIMFEALFILTTLDAGTRVGRYLLQDFLGRLHAPLGETRRFGANLLASVLMVSGWGFFLIQGVRDAEGGVKALWPIFGIANQMLAAIALCLGTTILLKMQLQRRQAAAAGVPRSLAVVLVTAVPLVWLLAVTCSAGAIKVFHPHPRMGFWAAAQAADQALPKLQQELAAARARGDAPAVAQLEQRVLDARRSRFNNRVDAVVTAVFLALIATMVTLSARTWWQLLRQRQPATLKETEPVWLPEYAVVEGSPRGWWGWLALVLLAAKEVSGQAACERAQQQALCACGHLHPAPPAAAVRPGAPEPGPPLPSRGEIVAQMLEKRYGGGVNRCC